MALRCLLFSLWGEYSPLAGDVKAWNGARL